MIEVIEQLKQQWNQMVVKKQQFDQKYSQEENEFVDENGRVNQRYWIEIK